MALHYYNYDQNRLFLKKHLKKKKIGLIIENSILEEVCFMILYYYHKTSTLVYSVRNKFITSVLSA